MAVRLESNSEPIPGYRLLDRLGGGGFGEVWRAVAPGGLHKAIKFVYGDLAGAGEDGQRAEQELKAMRRVQTVRHPYILSLERYDIIDGQLIIVMELADRNLWDRYKECRSQGRPGIPFDELISYMTETAEALDLMNGQYQLQHLDIKPQNLFLVHNHVKVADFGLVKDLEGMVASVTGGVTPVYAAPETFDGVVSRFCDQYSLGIVYQELLTGRRPFTGNNVRHLILQHLQASPDLSSLPGAQQPVIARALSKQADARFPTCAALIQALRDALPSAAGLTAVLPRPEPLDLEIDGPDLPEPIAPSALAGRAPPTSPALPAENPGLDLSVAGALAERLLPKNSDSNPSGTLCLRSPEPATLPPDEAKVAPVPPREEVQGEGILFPALLIGLGQAGLSALQQFRAQAGITLDASGRPVSISRQFSHLRLLLVDTDPEVMRPATQGEGTALDPSEVFLAPLNRPGYYLKPSPTKQGPALESWLNPRMLYRIPRSQVTTGVRALGRLAFFDHYRSIARRLKAELDACTEPGALLRAAEESGLGLRTNLPRIYLITSLAGGTGSGMFLDVAYTLRALLRRVGYKQLDIVALLLAPKISGDRPQGVPLGNSYAALKELLHYASPGTTFQAQYHEKEAAITDSEPPFSRCFVLPLPEEGDEARARRALARVGQFLYRDLFTPVGQAVERARADVAPPPYPLRGQFCNTFNLYPIRWPRTALVDDISRHMCARLVEGWASKQTNHLVEAVTEWIKKKWTEKDLAADHLLEGLQEELEEALGQRPETLVENCLRILRGAKSSVGAAAAADAGAQAQGAGGKERGLSSLFLFRARSAAHEAQNPDRKGENTDLAADIMVDLVRLLGKPGEDGLTEIAGEIEVTLRGVSDHLVEKWVERLVGLAVRLIEEPGFRIGGAEEGLRQMIALLEQTLHTYEPMAKELRERARAVFVSIQEGIAAGRTPGKKPFPPGAMTGLLREFGKARYQSLVLQQAVGAFLVLRGHLSDELREINYCRARLAALLRVFQEKLDAGKTSAAARGGGLGREIFSCGAEDLPKATEQHLALLRPEDLFDLDQRMARTIRKRFRALAVVCTSKDNNLRPVEEVMLQTAREFILERLPDADVAEMFLQRYPDQDQLEEEILTCVEKAEPLRKDVAGPPRALSEAPRTELAVIATPPGPAGERFAELANPYFSNCEVHFLPHEHDLVIYREWLNLKLTELEQFGPQSREAYLKMNATEHFTPHARIDENWPDLES